MRTARAAFILLLTAFSAPAFCRGAQVVSPFEEKMRYEKALEQKADEILLKVLGPNQARVTVEAAVNLEQALPSGKKEAEAPQSQFAWLNAEQKKEKMKELLPGFSAPMTVTPMGEDEAKAFGYKVSKINVTVIASGQLSQAQTAEISDLVFRVLGLDSNRGDNVDLVRAQFAPVWKTILYSPEYLSFLVRYGIIAVVIIISFMIIGLGIMRLAGAMGKMAKAQEHEVSIGFEGEGGGGGREAQPALPEPAGEEAAGNAPGNALPVPEGAVSDRLVFNVKKDQVPLLLSMLKDEDSENISLVVYHLPDDIRGELLSNMGKELASQVMLNLAKVRFVDKEMISEIKEELESRLDSAVGGVNKVVEMIAPMRYSGRKEMLRQFAVYNPQLAAEIRSVLIMDDDLLSLSEKDIGIVATSMPVIQWAEIFPGLADELKGKIKAQLSEKSVQMIEQTMQDSQPGVLKVDEAMDKFMALVGDLVKSGRIARPSPAQKLIGASTPAEPPAAAVGTDTAAKGGSI